MGIVAPEHMAGVFAATLASLTRNSGWFYLWVVLALVLFAAYVAFSRYGSLKLGGEDDEPEFSIGSWFAMLVAAGIAISLLLAGGIEAVQTATILFALPLALVIVLMVIALWRALREDWQEEARRERLLRRRMREMAAQ